MIQRFHHIVELSQLQLIRSGALYVPYSIRAGRKIFRDQFESSLLGMCTAASDMGRYVSKPSVASSALFALVGDSGESGELVTRKGSELSFRWSEGTGGTFALSEWLAMLRLRTSGERESFLLISTRNPHPARGTRSAL